MNIALVLSGGTGTRLGADIPKQYIEVGGKMILLYCLEVLLLHPSIDAVQIVADAVWQQKILEEIDRLPLAESRQLFCEKFRGFSEPGATRQLSILNGLEDICSYASASDVVMVHDAARPCLTAKLVSMCLMAICGHDGVLPVLPMKDTIYLSETGKQVSSLLTLQRGAQFCEPRGRAVSQDIFLLQYDALWLRQFRPAHHRDSHLHSARHPRSILIIKEELEQVHLDHIHHRNPHLARTADVWNR